MFFLIHLECPRCGKKYPVGEILNLRLACSGGNRRFLDPERRAQESGRGVGGFRCHMLTAVREIAETEGLITSPEGGATLAGLKKLLFDGFLGGHGSIVLFLTATGYKYLEALEQIV
jgi:hypothetical protein